MSSAAAQSMSSTTTPMTQLSPGEMAGIIDLLFEILSYLPVESLIRFQTVCKQWRSLISSPYFSLIHSFRHSRCPSSAIFFLHHRRRYHPSNYRPSLSSYEFISLQPTSPPPFLPLLQSRPLDIVQSCNGLLLCCNHTHSPPSTYFIFNPTTNQTVSIFLPPGHEHFIGLNLAFDPSRSAHYEIVFVWRNNDDGLYGIDVYSSGSRQWRRVVNSFSAPHDVLLERGVYCDSRVYWIGQMEDTVAFNLDKECVETVILPNFTGGDYKQRFRYFGESCGHLHLIEIPTNCVPDFEIMELDRREKIGWFVKHKVNLDVVGRGFEAEMFLDHSDRFGRNLRFYAFSILAVIRQNECENEDDEGTELVLSIPGKVISYNLKSKISRLICDIVDESDKWIPLKGDNAYQFIESLYCL